VYESASRFDAASFSPDPPYNGLITAHAVFQIFFMVMPVLFGSQDTAFPRLNNIAFGIDPHLVLVDAFDAASMLAVVLSALPRRGQA
jgi:heme/copper-type cytochrome/quinol oxidase subunit 1